MISFSGTLPFICRPGGFFSLAAPVVESASRQLLAQAIEKRVTAANCSFLFLRFWTPTNNRKKKKNVQWGRRSPRFLAPCFACAADSVPLGVSLARYSSTDRRAVCRPWPPRPVKRYEKIENDRAPPACRKGTARTPGPKGKPVPVGIFHARRRGRQLKNYAGGPRVFRAADYAITDETTGHVWNSWLAAVVQCRCHGRRRMRRVQYCAIRT